MHVILETPITETPRVLQVRGMFDLPSERTSRCEWTVELPLVERRWHLGLIVGPSGCGKSSLARALFPEAFAAAASLAPWPTERSILDAFPSRLSIKDITGLLSSVGFSSPPAWLRPYSALSTGQRFRCDLARLLAESASWPDGLAVFDEYTSVVDRTVAQIGSAAVAKTVRNRDQRFVAVTCHDDVAAWLQPDWVYRPTENSFTWRCLQRRPAIELSIVRCHRSAWRLFRPHHYLNHQLAPSAVCFLASWHGKPVAFSAWINQLSRRGGKREHRTVVLPDYQGVGIGMALSSFCAALWTALSQRATSTTTHPAFTAARQRSPLWRLVRRPALSSSARERCSGIRHAATRLTAGFEYIGPPLDNGLAQVLVWQDDSRRKHSSCP